MLIITGFVLAVVMAGSLLAPVPEWWAKKAAPLAFWRRDSIRQRLGQRRPLAVTYLGLVALVFVVWMLPSLLTRHPHIADAADRHTAITQTRVGLVAMLAAIGAAGGLAYTARTYRLSREGHITDRYSKSVEQLGDEKIEVRLGGIYALERLMHDSPDDQPTIMETLGAFVRQHAPHSPRPTLPGRGVPLSAPDHLAEDVQAVLTVLRLRHPVNNEPAIDLGRTNVTRANLMRANLTCANLMTANLTRANLIMANLTGASLYAATLTGAFLHGATLTGAHLTRANLTGAHLDEANLTGAHLTRANLTGVSLHAANLTDANLDGATLTHGALSEEQLDSARNRDAIKWVEDQPPHEGSPPT